MGSEKKLKNKVALVTGGSRGIGKAICIRLACDGAFIIIHYAKNKSLAENVLAEVIQHGGSGAIIEADFRSIDGVATLMKKIDETLETKKLNGIDIFVNNAGIGLICGIEEMTETQFNELFEINVKSPFFVTQKMLSRINDGGRIISISSIVTRMALPMVGAYSMTKGALDSMTLFLAKQLGSRQITVNSVAPGIVNTEMNEEALKDAQSRKYIESLSTFNRVGEPNDIADVVAFLASDDGRWISGQRLEASGGSFLG